MDAEAARTTPVEEGCVWCKKTPDEADPSVTFHTIDTGEQLCSRCLGDCRCFKRTKQSQVTLDRGWFDETLGPDDADAFARTLSETVADVADEFGITTSSTVSETNAAVNRDIE